MKTLRFFFILFLMSFISCVTVPPEGQDGQLALDPLDTQPETTNTVTNDANGFQVSQDVYNSTFNEIEALIKELNLIIFERRFVTWKSYLDEKYIEEIGNPTYLAQFSDRPILKKYNIRLRNLNEYFEYVVVPSRSNAKLDEILFIDQNRVTAYMYIQNQKTILYQLKNDGKSWKISIW